MGKVSVLPLHFGWVSLLSHLCRQSTLPDKSLEPLLCWSSGWVRIMHAPLNFWKRRDQMWARDRWNPRRHWVFLVFFIDRISSSSPITQVLLVSLALALLALSIQPSEARSVALPSPQCHPAVVNTMKPRIRQICKALEAIWEFSDVMENYLDEKGNEWLCSISVYK